LPNNATQLPAGDFAGAAADGKNPSVTTPSGSPAASPDPAATTGRFPPASTATTPGEVNATSDGTAASAATRQDRPPRPPARWRKTRPRLSPFPLKPPAACRTHAPDQVITRPTDSAA